MVHRPVAFDPRGRFSNSRINHIVWVARSRRARGWREASVSLKEGQELLPSALVVTELAQHRRGGRLGVDLLHPTHHHAHMPEGNNHGLQLSEENRHG